MVKLVVRSWQEQESSREVYKSGLADAYGRSIDAIVVRKCLLAVENEVETDYPQYAHSIEEPAGSIQFYAAVFSARDGAVYGSGYSSAYGSQDEVEAAVSRSLAGFAKRAAKAQAHSIKAKAQRDARKAAKAGAR